MKGLGSRGVRTAAVCWALLGRLSQERTVGVGLDKMATPSSRKGCPVNPPEFTPSKSCPPRRRLELRGEDTGDWTLFPGKDQLSKRVGQGRGSEPPPMKGGASEEGSEAVGSWTKPLRSFPNPRVSQ